MEGFREIRVEIHKEITREEGKQQGPKPLRTINFAKIERRANPFALNLSKKE